MTVFAESTTVVDGHTGSKYGKVSFVDLAGSERLKASKSSGEVAVKETGNINRSLFTLGKVIALLGDARTASGAATYIPYRDSKLTKLLQDSLGGSALALMVACCSPSPAHVEETLSTLYYASQAKNIVNTPTIQSDPQEQVILALRKEVELLRSENAHLRAQLGPAALSLAPPPLPRALLSAASSAASSPAGTPPHPGRRDERERAHSGGGGG
eukprot:CAMPEP_0170148718 /NCGR_PEP_ID=MMETSP0033_2-20121228/40118_1 /TAXON_ID=195969 /ORGANISM="Dolichomastix tenuilepis, Strain CCMP3274" /LENGTH=213 /DNA_ID=CAMNT_0010385623 /DNA_START=101 /DNA_END=739 /DNA_ORIENTATION=+